MCGTVQENMIVYGDPSYEEPVTATLGRVRQWADRASGHAPDRTDSSAKDCRPTDLCRRVGRESFPDAMDGQADTAPQYAAGEGRDARRRLLIDAGQLEQALADRVENDTLVERIMSVTDLAADAFLHDSDLGPLQEALAQLELPVDLTVRVKVPEGFAFYALYPEQYAQAARLWVRNHADSDSRRAVVVGIRSIGTSLSAVVARELAQAGWNVRRLTVRPSGHPYARRAAIPREAVQGAVFGLVVDEGPGLSGSSMAAAAQALVEAGLDRSGIGFFPGHDRGPGNAGTEDVRRWWSDTPRYVVGPSEMAWQGRPLAEELAYRSGPAVRVDDLSGGMWRHAVYRHEQEWPAAFVAFERAKYRVVRRDGSSVLWKFEGLAGGAEAVRDSMAWLAQRGWTLAPLDSAHGFVARLWIEGKPLQIDQCNTAVLDRIGRYIVDAAGTALSISEQRTSLERLKEMLYWNTRESLGEALATRTLRWNGLVPEHPWPAYGDGRLAPEEWIRSIDGRLIKVDCAGHSTDHTVIGRQPLIWDLAGATVEWRLDSETVRPLLSAFADAGGELPTPGTLAFYCAAYAAFRLGQCAICAGMSDPSEQRRLLRAGDFYESQLFRILA
jgi:hypothetical protein